MRRLEPDHILGAADVGSKTMLFIRWKGCEDETDLVGLDESREKIPQAVIKFYEDHIDLNSD